MPIASLSRFSVPLATDQSASNQGLLMPKLPYRFRVTLVDFGVGGAPATELTKQVVSVDRPKPSFEQIDLHVYNSIVKLAGKPKWEDIKLKLRDDMTNLVTNKVGEQMQKQFDFYEQSSAASGLDYKFTLRIEMLDGGNGASSPNVLETWQIYGCLLSQVNYGEVNYTSNDPVKVQLTIKFDNAIQTPQGTGIGTLVGRALGTTVTG